MEHIMVGLLGPVEWGRSIGKETSTTSFGIGALKRDDRIITTLYPSRYPEKIRSLLFVLSLADDVYLKVDRLDRYFGETIIALDLMNKKTGFIHPGPMVDPVRFSPIIGGTVVEGYREFDPEPSLFRQELFESSIKEGRGPTEIIIDQSFNVKGVGCVVLGFVKSGSVEKHQELTAYPSGKKTLVRSIQIHDRDHHVAPVGARVGLALRNITPEDLARGTLLSSSEDVITTDELKLRFRLSKYWKQPLQEGSRFHLVNSLQILPVQLTDIRSVPEHENEFECRARLEGPLWLRPGDRFGLVYLDSNSFRLFASGESI